MLTITRTSESINATRAYKVVLDGVVIGKIKNGQTARYELSPGAHTLVLRIDWCRSNIVEFDTDDGAADFACGAYVEGLIASIVKRDSYLYVLPAEFLQS